MGFDCERKQIDRFLDLLENAIVCWECTLNQSKQIEELTAKLKAHTDALTKATKP